MERCNEIRVPSEEAVQLVEYCIQNGYKISTAESCTGGLIAAGIVDVPVHQMSLKRDMLRTQTGLNKNCFMYP